MVAEQTAGFREHPHTADWALDVWAPDQVELLRQAAIGMYALMGVHLVVVPRVTAEFDLPVSDPETLFVSFLSELLYFNTHDNAGFDAFDLTLDATRLHVVAGGAPIESQAKEIKAVTYHNLVIRSVERGLATTVVFDV